jgi:hypothetical protein
MTKYTCLGCGRTIKIFYGDDENKPLCMSCYYDEYYSKPRTTKDFIRKFNETNEILGSVLIDIDKERGV